ncbi:hypothetical protein GCM10027290_51820 [Micromonospora sonneratiae]
MLMMSSFESDPLVSGNPVPGDPDPNLPRRPAFCAIRGSKVDAGAAYATVATYARPGVPASSGYQVLPTARVRSGRRRSSASPSSVGCPVPTHNPSLAGKVPQRKALADRGRTGSFEVSPNTPDASTFVAAYLVIPRPWDLR